MHRCGDTSSAYITQKLWRTVSSYCGGNCCFLCFLNITKLWLSLASLKVLGGGVASAMTKFFPETDYPKFLNSGHMRARCRYLLELGSRWPTSTEAMGTCVSPCMEMGQLTRVRWPRWGRRRPKMLEISLPRTPRTHQGCSTCLQFEH
jgi:hypothetical protein